MLVIERFIGESVHTGNDVKMTLVEGRKLKGQRPRVRLAFEAPRSVTILRSELVTDDDPTKGPSDGAQGG